MNALIVVLIAFLVIFVIAILVCYEPKYVNELNNHLDKFTGSTVGMSSVSRDMLKPLEFKRLTSKPDEYIYSYDIPPSEHRRMLLITDYKDTRIFLNGVKQEEILERTSTRNTIATFLESNQRDLRIIVVSRHSKLPIMYMSMEEEPTELPAPENSETGTRMEGENQGTNLDSNNNTNNTDANTTN